MAKYTHFIFPFGRNSCQKDVWYHQIMVYFVSWIYNCITKTNVEYIQKKIIYSMKRFRGSNYTHNVKKHILKSFFNFLFHLNVDSCASHFRMMMDLQTRKIVLLCVHVVVCTFPTSSMVNTCLYPFNHY